MRKIGYLILLTLLTNPLLVMARESDEGHELKTKTRRIKAKLSAPLEKLLIIDQKVVQKVIPQYFTIENRGHVQLSGIKALSSHIIDTYNVDFILKQVLKNCRTDQEKAIALWQFMTRYVYHWTPAHRGNEVHEPLKLLNVYGYGFCDDSAIVLAKLWQVAGLKSRVWFLSGHVVPEVYYAGGWHLFDPDHRLYYTSGTLIVGVRDLESHPEIVERTTDPAGYNARSMARLYSTREDNRILGHGWAIGLNKINVVLRPGESWRRYRIGKSGYYDVCYHKEPRQYGNAIFTFCPDFKRYPATTLFNKASNVGTHYDSRKIKGLMLLPGKTSGHCIFRFSQHFICVDGEVRVNGNIKCKGGEVDISGSKDGKNWSLLEKISDRGRFNLSINLRELVYGKYSYFLKVAMKAEKASDVRIDKIEVETITQSSPLSFPVIKRGENRLSLSFDAPKGPDNIRLMFEYVWQEKVMKRPWWRIF